MKKVISILLFVSLFITYGFSQTNITTAVDFTATDVEGNEWHLFDLLDSGKYVFIDFFFTH